MDDRHLIMLKAVFLVCAIVFLVYSMTASGTIFNIDGAQRFQVTQNLYEQGRLDIQTTEPAPIGLDGKHYAQYAIGHSLMMLPFYLFGKQAGSFFPARKEEVIESSASLTNMVFTLLTVALLVIFAKTLGFTLRTSITLGLIYALGTMAWQQAKDSFEHPQIVFYVIGIFYFLYRFRQGRKILDLCLVSLFLGLALLTRYTAILIYPAVIVFLFYLGKGESRIMKKFLYWLAIILMTVLPFLLFNLWFNYLRFGSPLETGYQQLFGSVFSPKIYRTFFRAFWGLTFSWETGLFIFNPILLLFFSGFPLFYRRHKALAVAFLVLIILHFTFYSSLKDEFWKVGWAWGWFWGPRFLLDILPLMALVCAPLLEIFFRKAPRQYLLKAAMAGLLIVSVIIQIGSVSVNYHRSFYKKRLGIKGHSFAASGFRESSIYIQAENIREIWNNIRSGHIPAKERIRLVKTAADMDSSFTLGTLHFWWVYAWYLGAPKQLIILYLVISFLLLVLALRKLEQLLQAQNRINSVRSHD